MNTRNRTAPALLIIAIFSLLYMILPSPAFAGQWQAYSYTDQYRRVYEMGNKLYILKSNSLIQADAESWQIERELIREDGLSGTEITDICYSQEIDKLAIIYKNGMIDVLHADGTIWTIPDYYNDPMPGVDKSIVSVREQRGKLFLITAYGFAVVDLRNEVFIQSFHIGFAPTCAWEYNNEWYYSCTTHGDYYGSYYCPKNGANPFLPESWSRTGATIIKNVVVVERNGIEECWQQANDNSLMRLTPGRHGSVRCSAAGTVTSLMQAGRFVLACNADSLIFFDTNFGHAPEMGEPYQEGQRLAKPLSTVGGSPLGFCALGNDTGNYSFMTAAKGVSAYSITTQDKLIIQPLFSSRSLKVENTQQSPLINHFVVDPKGEIGMTYTPRIVNSYVTMLKNQGFLTTYNPATDKWKNYGASVVSQSVKDPSRFVGVTNITADPFHEQRYLFCTLEDGIIVIDHGSFFARYNDQSTNLGLEVCAPKCTRIGGIGFNNQGDMWCFDEGHNYGIRVLCAADGKWYRYRMNGLEKSYGFQGFCVTRHGDRHQVWGYQGLSYGVSNLFCYDYGGTPSNGADDRYIYFKELYSADNADGSNSFVPYYGRGVYEGPDGAIWLLNTSGIYVIDDPDAVFEHPGRVRTIMTEVSPTCMSIDSQNHIWVSTEDKGIYLLSSDGREELAHFTTLNSILPTDEITNVCVTRSANQTADDEQQSVLWISTDGQILTYTYPDEEYGPKDEDNEQIPAAYCYPASVRVGSNAVVNVFALQDGSKVSVSNSQGRILFEDTALATMATIDVSRLPVGFYTVTCTDANGQQGPLTSFEIVP